MPSVFDYTDYRAYLADWLKDEKSRQPSFSYGVLAARAGFSDRGFLHNVIHGRRALTKESLVRVSRAIGHTSAEADYFENLVFFNRATSPRDREHFYERMVAVRGQGPAGAKTQAVRKNQYEFYSAWYHSMVRELAATLRDPSPQAIAVLLVPRVTARQVAGSLKLQLSLGLLRRSKNGRYERADAFIAAGGVERNTALVRFQREMLSQAHNAWERSKPGEISMHTATFVMPEDQLDKARELTRACTNRLLELSNAKSSAPLRVYHANINVFPVTRPVKES